jgi:hypothetical protein
MRVSVRYVLITKLAPPLNLKSEQQPGERKHYNCQPNSGLIKWAKEIQHIVTVHWATFLKTLANGKTAMREVKTLWENWS